jgi:hypothetical protein
MRCDRLPLWQQLVKQMDTIAHILFQVTLQRNFASDLHFT